jgi:hypothetical protein
LNENGMSVTSSHSCGGPGKLPKSRFFGQDCISVSFVTKSSEATASLDWIEANNLERRDTVVSNIDI